MYSTSTKGSLPLPKLKDKKSTDLEKGDRKSRLKIRNIQLTQDFKMSNMIESWILEVWFMLSPFRKTALQKSFFLTKIIESATKSLKITRFNI